MTEQLEKRKYRRIFFSPENRLSAVFEPSGVTAVVLDMSRGGMGASIRRTSGLTLAQNDQIRITGITGGDGLVIDAGFPVEIRWVVDQPGFEYIAFGCRFLDPSQTFIDAIGAVIDQTLAEKTE